MVLPDSIRHIEVVPGYPVFEINHPACTARIAQNGAHLMEWTPAGQKPVLYISPEAVFRKGSAIRGGVPVCWPWFGPHETDGSLPAHGFARVRSWQLTTALEEESGVTVKFALKDDAETRRMWPHAFELEMEMQLGTEMHLALRMTNTGDAPFTISGALHSYFAVGDIGKVTAEGLDGVEYFDKVVAGQARRQSGPVVFDREVDRCYDTGAAVVVKDAAWNRSITVQGSGSRTAVVWNPWIDKSRTLSDLPDDDYKRFVCVETANAWRDHVTVPPGAQHVLATKVGVA